MTPHYCPVEKTNIAYDGECNWCGEKEPMTKDEYCNHSYVVSDRLAWVTWAFLAIILFSLMLGTAYVIGRVI